MKRSTHASSSALGLFCTVLLCSVWAHGQDASAAETAAARSLAVEGLKLAQAGNCSDAVPKLERAEKLYHSAVVASRLGECYVSVGRLVEGSEILRKVLREPQPSEPTPALSKALERAQRALDAAKPRIAGITVKATNVEGLRVKVDGVELSTALLDNEIPTDPGEHEIEATAPGYLASASRVHLADAEKKSVSFTLSRDPNAVAAAPAAVATTTTPSESAPRAATGAAPEPAPSSRAPAHKPSYAGAYVAYGLGAVGIGVGSALGVMTLQRRQDLKTQCPGDVCPPARQATLDDAKRLGTFSTIAFGVGAAGLALGTVLVLTSGSSSEDKAQHSQRSLAGVSNLRAAIGPTAFELGGDF